MKNFTLLAFMILFLSACVKEDIAPLVTDSPDGITRLYVKVTFFDCYSGQSCPNTADVPVSNADVYLYENGNNITDGKTPLMQGQSDGAGLVRFEKLENSKYDLEVNCTYGTIKQKVHVEEGKTTRINIRY